MGMGVGRIRGDRMGVVREPEHAFGTEQVFGDSEGGGKGKGKPPNRLQIVGNFAGK